MPINRSVTNVFATFLMVTAILLIMNLIASPETMADWTALAALVTFAGAVALWVWQWWEDRPRAAVEPQVTDVIPVPQVREFVIDRPAPRLAVVQTPAASETAVVSDREEPAAAGVVSPASAAAMEAQGHKGDVPPAIEDPLHPDLTPKIIRHQEEVQKQAEAFEEEQQQMREHPGGENFQPHHSTEQQQNPPELAKTTDAQQGTPVNIPEKPAEPDLDREGVANEAAAAPMGESETVQAAQNGDPIAEKQVGEASAAHPVEPISDETAATIAEQVTPEKAVNYAETEVTEAKLSNDYVDELEQIEGIGPFYRDLLVKAGVKTFKQLSEMSHEQINDILQKAEVKRIPRSTETWAEQAAYLVRGDREGLSAFQATLTGGRRAGGDD